MGNCHIIGVFSFLLICYISCGVSANNDQSKNVAGHKILKTYNQDNSVVDGRIDVIFQDGDGRFWIADYSGVHMFDEKRNEWSRFTKEKGELVAGPIEWVGQSGDNKIWFAGRRQSLVPGPNLSCFDGEHWLKPESAPKNSVIRNRITAMFPGRNGRLWFALKDELRVYDGTEWRPGLRMSEAIEEDDPVTVRVGLQDSSGCIWLGTTHGILRFDEQRKEWRICNPFEQNSTSTSSALKDRYVREIAKRGIIAIYEDRRRRIWFVDVEGHVMIWKAAEKTWTSDDLSEHLPSGMERVGLVHAMYQDDRGLMMFATSYGLLTFNESDSSWGLFTPENSGLPRMLITSIYEDRNRRIWVGTGKGIVVLEQ